MKITKNDLAEIGHEADLVDDWFSIRKDKRAPSLTERAWNGIKKQAMQCGLNEFQVIEVMVENEWRGFKAEWYNKAPAAQKQQVRTALRDIQDTNW